MADGVDTVCFIHAGGVKFSGIVTKILRFAGVMFWPSTKSVQLLPNCPGEGLVHIHLKSGPAPYI